MHGQYLGSATLIYVKASSAANAIKQYNGAQLDDRVMKIEYAQSAETSAPKTKIIAAKRPQQQRLTVVKQPAKLRRGGNAI